MSRFQSKYMGGSWYLPSGSGFFHGGVFPAELVNTSENHLFPACIPPYLSTMYPNMQNVQQNNAMPMYPFGKREFPTGVTRYPTNERASMAFNFSLPNSTTNGKEMPGLTTQMQTNILQPVQRPSSTHSTQRYPENSATECSSAQSDENILTEHGSSNRCQTSSVCSGAKDSCLAPDVATSNGEVATQNEPVNIFKPSFGDSNLPSESVVNDRSSSPNHLPPTSETIMDTNAEHEAVSTKFDKESAQRPGEQCSTNAEPSHISHGIVTVDTLSDTASHCALHEASDDKISFLQPSIQAPPAFRTQQSHNQVTTPFVDISRGIHMLPNGAFTSYLAPPMGVPHPGNVPLNIPGSYMIPPPTVYLETLSYTIWHFYICTRQSKVKYSKKVQLRNALHVVVSGVFENAGLFIVGSSMNGFGSEQSDMDMCLTITSRDLQQKQEAFVVLSQLLPPLRKCSFIRNLHLIRAKVPILKFRDTLAGVDCDLNVNNVVGIYNTHLLAMYTKIDWRVRPLGMFVKFWAQRMDIHDGSRGRLSTYPLQLMLIQYLQAGCTPPVLPNLQARFPKLFNYARPLVELDMRVELPWDELRSNNPASLGELFIGFIHYYAQEFDFKHWAVSVRNGAPLPIDLAIRRLPPHEQAHTARNFKVFVEEPFCQSNAARCLYDSGVLANIKEAFAKTYQTLRSQRPLESIWVNVNHESNC